MIRLCLLLTLSLATCLFTGACHCAPAAQGDIAMIRTELYFGLSRHDGSAISEAEFAKFVADVITPRFPDGLTILDATGQWREPDGMISHERSKLLIVLHIPGDQSATAIEQIRGEYKTRFGQESVMRVTSPAGVAF